MNARGKREIVKTSAGHGPASRSWQHRIRNASILEPTKHAVGAHNPTVRGVAERAQEHDALRIFESKDVRQVSALRSLIVATELSFEEADVEQGTHAPVGVARP